MQTFCSLDAALDERNYEDIELTTFTGAEKEEVIGYLDPKPTRKNVERRKIVWTTDPPSSSGQHRKCDIIDTGRKRDRIPGAPYAKGKNIQSMGDAYDLLYTADMYELRMLKINGKIQAIRDLIPPHMQGLAKYRHIRPTNVAGIYFITHFDLVLS